MNDSPETPAVPAAPEEKASAAKPRATLGQRVLSAAVAIVAAHAMAKLLGIFQTRLIGQYFGLEAANDAYVAAYKGLIGSVFLLGEESIAPAYLPIFTASMEKGGERHAWRFTSSILNLFFLILVAVVAALMVFPDEAIQWLTRFSQTEGDAAGDAVSRSALAARFLAHMAPALFGLSLGTMTYVILVGYKRFFWAAFAEAGLKAAFVVALVAAHKLGLGDDALVAGAIAAGAAKIGIHLFALGGKLRFWRPVLLLGDERFRQFLLLVAPLLAGAAFAKFRDYFNYIYILSALEKGFLSINDFGRITYSAISWLVPYPLSIAMLPFLCEMVARDDRRALGDFLTRASRMLLLVFIPVAAVIAVLSVPLAQVLFEAGKMTAEKAAMVGQVNACYCAVLPFLALELVFMQAYFSTRRTLAVTFIGIFTSSLSMTGAYIGVVYFGASGLDAVMTVALCFTFSKALKSVILAAALKSEGLPFLPAGPTFAFLARCVALAAACAGASFGAQAALDRALPAKTSEQPVDRKDESKSGEPKKTEWEDAKTSESAKSVPLRDEKTAPAEAKTEEHSAKSEAAPPEEKSGAAPPKAAGEPAKPASGQGSTLRTLLRAGPRLALPGLAAAIIFVLGCKLLRLEEFDEMLKYAKEKLRRRGKQKPPEPAA